VTVTLPRPDSDEARLPPGGQTAAELAAAAAAATAAEGLAMAWTRTQSVVSMIVPTAAIVTRPSDPRVCRQSAIGPRKATGFPWPYCCTFLLYLASQPPRDMSGAVPDLTWLAGALGGTRTPNLLIRSYRQPMRNGLASRSASPCMS
jgi:hypothetical protein